MAYDIYAPGGKKKKKHEPDPGPGTGGPGHVPGNYIATGPGRYDPDPDLEESIRKRYALQKRSAKQETGASLRGKMDLLRTKAAQSGYSYGSGEEQRLALEAARNAMATESRMMADIDAQKMAELKGWAEGQRGYEYQSSLQQGGIEGQKELAGIGIEGQMQLKEMDIEGQSRIQSEQHAFDRWKQREMEKLTRAGWDQESAEAELDRRWKSGEGEAERENRIELQELASQANYDTEEMKQIYAERMQGKGLDAESAWRAAENMIKERDLDIQEWAHGEQFALEGGKLALEQYRTEEGFAAERYKTDLTAALQREGYDLEEAKYKAEHETQKYMQAVEIASKYGLQEMDQAFQMAMSDKNFQQDFIKSMNTFYVDIQTGIATGAIDPHWANEMQSYIDHMGDKLGMPPTDVPRLYGSGKDIQGWGWRGEEYEGQPEVGAGSSSQPSLIDRVLPQGYDSGGNSTFDDWWSQQNPWG